MKYEIPAIILFALFIALYAFADSSEKNEEQCLINYYKSAEYSQRMQIARHKAKIYAFASIIEKCAEEDYRTRENVPYGRNKKTK